MPTYIYGLIDPTTHLVSYVGQTIDLYGRWEQHTNDMGKSVKGEWIKKLDAAGLKPQLIILDMVEDGGDTTNAERWWIAHGLRHGWPLTNTVYGATNGKPLSEIIVPVSPPQTTLAPRKSNEDECVVKFVYRRTTWGIGPLRFPAIEYGFRADITNYAYWQQASRFYPVIRLRTDKAAPREPRPTSEAWDALARIGEALAKDDWQYAGNHGNWYAGVYRRLSFRTPHNIECPGCKQTLELSDLQVYRPVICNGCLTLCIIYPRDMTMINMGKLPPLVREQPELDNRWAEWAIPA